MPRIRRPALLAAALLVSMAARAATPREKVILDSDIDDAYALALAVHSPELELIGVATAWGDTALRARLASRFLQAAGRSSIPVATGIATRSKTEFSQQAWAAAGPAAPHRDAVAFLLDEARRYPHQVTLIAIGPLTNIGAAIDRDPAGFRLLKRIVMMGGSIRRGYGDPTAPASPPEPEYNIAMDPAAASKLLASGVPIYMLPLDATQWKLDEAKMAAIAGASTPLTDALLVLTAEWQLTTHQHVPTLYDAMAVAYTLQPQLCDTTPLHLEVDGNGFTREASGSANVHACLNGNGEAFFRLLLPRVSRDSDHAAE